jgi:hypothetical protein
MTTALAAEANSIFDILNLYVRGPPPNPETSHRYYLCKEPPPGTRMSPFACEQVPYARVLEFLKEKETTPTSNRMVPIEKSNPRVLDTAILSCKLFAPAVIYPSSR